MEGIDSTGTSATTDPQPARRGATGVQRLTAAVLIAIGVMAAGGAAVVSAASPDPSASSTPSASSGASGGTGGTTAPSQSADCPNM